MTSSSLKKEVSESIEKSIYLKWSDSTFSQLKNFISINFFDTADFFFGDSSGNRLQEFEKISDIWDIRSIWSSIEAGQTETIKVFDNIINDLQNIGKKQELLRNFGIEVFDRVNLFVLLPAYQPVESVFLSFILRKIIPELKTKNVNFQILCLLPELKDNSLAEKINKRIYCCISEIDGYLSDNIELLNSFTFVSWKNEQGETLGGINDIILACSEFINHHFILDRESQVLNLRNMPAIDKIRDRIAIYSSFGTSIYAYRKRKVIDQVLNYLIYNTLKDFQQRLSDTKIERELLYNQVELFFNENKWGRLEEHFEKNILFSKFSSLADRKYDLSSDAKVDVIINNIITNSERYLSPEGYFKKSYIPEIHKNYKAAVEENKKLLINQVGSYLQNSIEGYNLSKGFLLSLVGREELKSVEGEQLHQFANLLKLKIDIADHYRQFLPENEVKVDSGTIIKLEIELKNKLELAQNYKTRIERIEKEILGWDLPVEEVIRKEGDKLYFTIDDQKININGYKEDNKIPEGIPEFKSELAGSLPSLVDLREHMTPVENQGSAGSCVANALVSNYEYFIFRGSNQVRDLSRLFVYYNGRKKSSSQNQDNGSSPELCLQSMKDTGTCLETTWPYEVENTNVEPNEQAYAEAKNYEVLEANYFMGEVSTMKQCLASGFPFVIVVKTFESFHMAGSKGIVPMPDPVEISSNECGLHAMLCVGYSETDKYFIARNSWGLNWGDRGYCYIPYEYFISQSLVAGWPFHLIRKVTDIKETEFKYTISRDNESLFLFGNDLIELNLLRKEYEKLKLEIDKMSQSLDSNKIKFESQNLYVLNPSFRNDVLAHENELINKDFEEMAKQLDENKKEIKKLIMEKQEIVSDGKNLKIRLMAIYPGLALLGISAIVVLSSLFIPFKSIFYFFISHLIGVVKIFGLAAFIYGVYAYYKYWKLVIKPNNEKQSVIEAKEREGSSILRLIYANRDNFFENHRKHKIFDLKLDFIDDLKEFIVDELITRGFEGWMNHFTEVKEKFFSKIHLDDLKDSYLQKNAFNVTDLETLNINSILDNMLTEKTGFMKPYFINGKQEIDIKSGIKKFTDNIADACILTDQYTILNESTVLDFFFGRKKINRLFGGDKKRLHENELKSLIMASSPLLLLSNQFDSYQLDSNFLLSLPDSKTEEVNDLINKCNVEYKEPLEQFSVTNNDNNEISQITIFRTSNLLPAYFIKSLQTAFIYYKEKPEPELFTDDKSAKYSFIPDEIKSLL